MILSIVKEVKMGEATYYLTEDGKFRAGTICNTLTDALDMFENIKLSLNAKRTEIIMQEEI
jgi:hypothetical protein